MKARLITLLVFALFTSTFLYAQAPAAPVATAASAVGNLQFTANWNYVWNATSYRLDVSTASNFSTFVSGYNNLSVSGTSITLYSNIMPLTTYYYRVRAVNGSGTSVNSNVVSVTTNPITVPNPPVATAASSISSSSFNANWSSAAGATHYFIDVSTVSNFATFLPGYNNINTNTLPGYWGGTSVINIGLSPYTTYYYRVRAANGYGSGQNSNVIAVTTSPNAPPPAPVANPATSVSPTSFQANWSPSYSASGYRIDISTVSDFSSFVGPYNNGNVTSWTSDNNSFVSIYNNLAPGTTYFYRLRAVNIAGASANSNVVTISTTPASPTPLTATEISLTTFSLSWPTVTGAIEYEVDLSTSSSFASFTTDVLPGTSITKTGLPSGVTHYVRVRAKGIGGYSSNTSKTIQLQAPPDVAPPSALLANSFQANCIPNASGTASYYAEVFSDVTLTTPVGTFTNPSSTTGIAVNGLQAGTTYFYRFRQMLQSGLSVASPNHMTVVTSPAPPALFITDINPTSFRVNWSAVPTAISYLVQQDDNAGFSSPNSESIVNAPLTNAIVNSVLPSVYVRVRANSPSSSSVYASLPVTLGNFTPVANPSPSNVTTSSFQANWSNVSGATGYQLDVASDAAFTNIVTGYSSLPVSGPTYTVTGLTSCVGYYYRLRAAVSSGLSSWSNVVGPITTLTTPPLAPLSAPASEISSTEFRANWAAPSSGCVPTDYRIDVASNASFTTLIVSNQLASVTNHTVTGLTPGVTYYYRVRSTNSAGTSSNSTITSVTTGNYAPVLLPASAITNTSFIANWQAVSGASGYTLDVSTNPTFATKVVDNLLIFGTSQNVVGLISNTNYHFRVRSITVSGYSTYISASTITAPNAPTGLFSSSPASNSFTANWGAVAGITDYELDVSSAPDFTAILPAYNDITITGTQYPVVGLQPGTAYYFRIRAKNTSGSSANSSISAFTTLPTPPTATVATGVGGGSFMANWSTVSGASSYRLDVSTVPTFASFVPLYNDLEVPLNSQTVSGLSGGTVYYYRVRAVHPTGTSSSSNVIQVTTAPAPPVASVSNVLSNSFAANSSSAPSATEYRLDVSTNSSFLSYLPGLQDVSAGTSYLVAGLTPNTQYYLRFRARNASGTSINSNTVSVVTQLSSPTANHSAISASSFTVSWGVIAGATEYRLDVSSSSTFTSGVIQSNMQVLSTSQIISTGLMPNTIYYYRVRAANPTNTSSYSSTGSVYTLMNAPTANNASSVSSTSFIANWTLNGANTYELDVSTNSSFSSFLPGYNALQISGSFNSRNIPGLTASTNYYYRLRSVNFSGASANSNTITVTTICPGCRIASEIPNDNDEVKNLQTNPFVYPNAVERQLNIVLPESMKKAEITSFRVIDLIGREFQVSFAKNTKEEFEADVTTLQKGMYILFIETKESKYQVRFLKK